jgi:general secretion pathway protein J
LPSELSAARATGFTLLEVLVALAVMGLLILGLTQGTRTVLTSWDKQARRLTRQADLEAVDRTLRYLIKNARPGSEWEPSVFVGTAHSVAFTTVMPVSPAGVRTQRADVELLVDAAHRLLLVSRPHYHAVWVGPPSPASATQIIQGVERVEMNYWAESQVGGWTTDWRDSAPPRLVRIRIVFSDPDQPQWPDIVAAPVLDPL